MSDVPFGPAAVFAMILIGYFVMTVWYGQAHRPATAAVPKLLPAKEPENPAREV